MPLPIVEIEGIIESDVEPGKYLNFNYQGNVPADEEGNPVLSERLQGVITDPAEIERILGRKGTNAEREAANQQAHTDALLALVKVEDE